MRIIDMHTHVWDLPSAEFPWQAPVKPLTYGRVRSEPAGQPAREFQLLSPSFAQSVAPAEMLLHFMDWAEVERAAILPSFLHGFDNRYIASCTRRWPNLPITAPAWATHSSISSPIHRCKVSAGRPRARDSASYTRCG